MGRKKRQDNALQPGFDPMASEGKIKVDLEQNGDRMEHEVLAQAARERHGHYVRVDKRTMLFIRHGRNASECVAHYLSRHKK